MEEYQWLTDLPPSTKRVSSA